MTTLRVDTIRALTTGGNLTIGDATNSAFAALPVGTMIAGKELAIATTQTIGFAMSDETDELTGSINSSFHLPHNFTVQSLSAGLTTPKTSTGNIVISFTLNGLTTMIGSVTLDTDAIPPASAQFNTVSITSDNVFSLNDTITATAVTDGTGGIGLKVYLNGFAMPVTP